MKIVLFFLFSTITTAQSQVWYLFSHGVADTYKQAYKYAKTYKIGENTHHNTQYLIKRPFVNFNYPDAYEGFPRINRKETSFAQDNEIARLKLAF